MRENELVVTAHTTSFDAPVAIVQGPGALPVVANSSLRICWMKQPRSAPRRARSGLTGAQSPNSTLHVKRMFVVT